MSGVDITEILYKSLTGIIASISVAVATFALISALRSGVLKKIRFGSFEIEASEKEKQEARALFNIVAKPEEPVPFETEQLARYYAQVLAQSKISFWFSLIFASLGFTVIIAAGFMFSKTTTGASVAQFIAGIIMDAVSGLFFVQSRNAQTAMGEFFDKLRRDRQQVESRKLCESVVDPQAKDALKIQLSLHYAEIENSDSISKTIMEMCLRKDVDDKAKI